MGKEERVALRKKPKVEDLFIGAFGFLALLYPFLITLLIEIEELKSKKLDPREKLRITAFFVGGLEECTKERASKISSFFEREALHKLGGEEGLLKMCLENRSKLGYKFSVNVNFKDLGGIYLLDLKISGVGKPIRLEVSGKTKGTSFYITGVSQR